MLEKLRRPRHALLPKRRSSAPSVGLSNTVKYKPRRWLAAAFVVVALTAFAFFEAGPVPGRPRYAAASAGGRRARRGDLFRAMVAARLYKQGWAPEVWLTQGGLFRGDVALDRLNIERTPEHSTASWSWSGSACRPQLSGYCKEETPKRPQSCAPLHKGFINWGGILVTGSYHSRRVKLHWRKLIGDHPEAVVRYTQDGAFEPHRWWRDAADALAV